MKNLLPLSLAVAWAVTTLGYVATLSELGEANTRTAYAIAQTEEALALAEQLKIAKDDSSDVTDRAIAEATRAIAQTKEAIALLRACTEGT